MNEINVKKFMNFFDRINSRTSGYEFFIKTQDAVGEIAESLGIARIELKCDIEKKYIVYNGNDVQFIVYQSQDQEVNPDCKVVVSSRTESIGKVLYTAYASKEHGEWTSDERDEVRFVLNILHSVAALNKISDNVHTVLSIDKLTGALNQYSIYDSINKYISDGKIGDYSCAFLNIKNFKRINKEFGTEGGDIALEKYSKALLNFCSNDEMVARMGGDNFVILLEKVKKNDWKEKLKGITINLKKSDGTQTKVLIESYAGFSDISPAAKSQDMVIQPANVAFRFAKFVQHVPILEFDDKIKNIVAHQQFVISTYRKAMANGDIVLYYQPKVDLKTYKVCGAEALSRWNYNGEVKSPFWYIPILEQSNAICDLDFFNLKLLCKTIREWIDDGLEPVRVSINFSRRHLKNPNLAANIFSIINEYKVPKDFIEIEITETVDTDEYNKLVKFIGVLRENGIKVSIDDFGTGFSSVNILKDVPVDIIKMDKSFLDKTDYEDKIAIVISDIIKMAKDLNIETVAEGVETRPQADFLENINCNIAQGYYFDKPLTKENFTDLLKKGGYNKN